MPKLTKQCPNGHRTGSNSQKTCRTCDHRFYKQRSSPIACTKVCPSCKVRVRGNNTKICKTCQYTFTKRTQPATEITETDIDSFLAILSTDVETMFQHTMSKAGIEI